MIYLYYLLSLASLVCFIMVLIKQFKTAGVVHGIIGIITCGLWTLIWGWINAGKLGIRNLMIIWTVLILLCIIIGATSGAMSFTYGVPGTPVTP